MRVAVFTDNDFEKVNGVTTVLRALLDHAPADIQPRIYTCDSAGTDRSDYLALRSVGVGIPYYAEMKIYLPPLSRLLQRAREDGIELVHVTTPGPLGLAALWVSSRLGVPLIGSFHTHLEEYTRRLSGSPLMAAVMREYMRWLYAKCEGVLAPSEATRQVLINSRLDPARIRIWDRGVSTTNFSPEKRSPALRQRWGVSEDLPAIVYVGRLSAEKGLRELAPFQAALDAAHVAHRLIIVGDGPMRAELERACPGAVFTGSIPHEEVAVAMASADLFLFPSRTDTAGNVVLEAQASGLPVLVSDEGGPQENIRPGESGEICRTLADFVVQATRLSSDASARGQASVAARRYALTRSWERALSPLFCEYRDTVAIHRRTRARSIVPGAFASVEPPAGH